MSRHLSEGANPATADVGRLSEHAPEEPSFMATPTYDGEEDRGNIDRQKPVQRFFRRPRAGRACGTCHSRRIRCDAGSHGLPCTNCAAFSIECSIPPKKKKREAVTVGSLKRRKPSGRPTQTYHDSERNDDISIVPTLDEFASLVLEADQHIKLQPDTTETYAKIVKAEIGTEAIKSEIEDPGRVAYVEEFSNLSLILQEYQGPVGVHYSLPKSDKALTKVNQVELEILKARGALSLPPKELCDELIEAYFQWVAPIVPIINKGPFMRRYRDPTNPPPLLLMQAVLLAGSRVCNTALLQDANGSTLPAATLLYQRVKALYDADFEEDRVTIVQALILMGWYWEDPGRVPKTVFYWTGLAIAVAQGCGMHRSTKNSRLSLVDQRLWTRIWWTLYTRDRSVAAALGQPTHISLDGSDVEMICEDHFIDEHPEPNAYHVQFFLQYFKLCQIMDLVLFQHYSVSPKAHHGSALALTQCDLALAEWLQNCPPELRSDPKEYSFWSSYLDCVYFTVVCLLHRAHLPPVPSGPASIFLTRSPAFDAAQAITSIVQTLGAHDDLSHAPPFIIYSLLSALMVHIYHLHTATPNELNALQMCIVVCMRALERVSKFWLVGKMVHDLFVAILASDGFDYLLQNGDHDQNHNLLGMKSSRKELDLDRNPTTGSEVSEKSIKHVPLTPSLVAHMCAALKSAIGPDRDAP